VTENVYNFIPFPDVRVVNHFQYKCL